MDKNLSLIQRQFLAQPKEEQTAQLKSMAATLFIQEYERMKRNERWGMTFDELADAVAAHAEEWKGMEECTGGNMFGISAEIKPGERVPGMIEVPAGWLLDAKAWIPENDEEKHE